MKDEYDFASLQFGNEDDSDVESVSIRGTDSARGTSGHNVSTPGNNSGTSNLFMLPLSNASTSGTATSSSYGVQRKVKLFVVDGLEDKCLGVVGVNKDKCCIKLQCNCTAKSHAEKVNLVQGYVYLKV